MPEEPKKIFYKKVEDREKISDEDKIRYEREKKEQKFEKDIDNKLTKEEVSEEGSLQNVLAKVPINQHPLQKTTNLIEIENILSQGLENIYNGLPSKKQLEVKKKGEETALKISLLLQRTKVKVKNIIKLIKNWLKAIPGINKFFLEQEAKIKTDRLLNLKKKIKICK
ncbi:MAG: hypothetical protein GWO87_00390 [Xanthomonadaceae bacterium]|nr:hypothetical protein [Rhodospirillaceae bacterium]NIA17639.1 hypothetical protein [Xanthomonadaceae bacterium]